MQAREHQMGLLRPSHPTPARIATMQAWVQDCVTAVDKAQRSEALIAHGDKRAHVTEIAAGIAPVVDALHMYGSMLERLRSISQVMMGSPHPGSLAAAADDERVLLSCRAALRTSLQQLTAALQADH